MVGKIKMDKEAAKKVLEMMLNVENVDNGYEFCVRKLFLKFIKEFPEYSYLARKMFRETFHQELVMKNHVQEIIKEVIYDVIKSYGLEVEKILLFGSRATGLEREDSDWDILLVVKQKINKKTKNELFKEITEKLSHYLIPCDIIIKSTDEIEFYKDFYGTATYEALKNGLNL